MEDQGPVKVAGLPHLTGLHLSAEGATHTLAASARRRQGKRSLAWDFDKTLPQGSSSWSMAVSKVANRDIVTKLCA